MLLERFLELLGSFCGSCWVFLSVSGNFCVLLGASGRSWTASVGASECLWELLCATGERQGFCWCFWEFLGTSGNIYVSLVLHFMFNVYAQHQCITSMFHIYATHPWVASMYHTDVLHIITLMYSICVTHLCITSVCHLSVDTSMYRNTSTAGAYVPQRCIAYYIIAPKYSIYVSHQSITTMSTICVTTSVQTHLCITSM